MHLKAEELVDLAERTRPESTAPHLASCAACRQRLADARAMLSEAADVDVPEPSPLFWDRFSDRVREAVTAEAVPPRSWIGATVWTRLFVPAAAVAVAAAIVGVLVSSRDATPRASGALVPSAGPAVASAQPTRDLLAESASSTEDPSLTLVTALTSNMDWDTAGEAGLAAGGSAEHAVTHLNDAELRELRRLLAEELARSGA